MWSTTNRTNQLHIRHADIFTSTDNLRCWISSRLVSSGKWLRTKKVVLSKFSKFQYWRWGVKIIDVKVKLLRRPTPFKSPETSASTCFLTSYGLIVQKSNEFHKFDFTIIPRLFETNTSNEECLFFCGLHFLYGFAFSSEETSSALLSNLWKTWSSGSKWKWDKIIYEMAGQLIIFTNAILWEKA